MRRATGFLALLILLSGGVFAADVEFPLTQAFTWFPYDENQLLVCGRTEFGLRLNYSNIFSYNSGHGYFVDMELASTTFAVRHGLSRGLTAELYVNVRCSWGGFLDRGIERFHSTFGYPDAGRPGYMRDVVHYRLNDRFDEHAGRSVVLPPVLAVLAELARGPHLWLRGRLAVGVPLGETVAYSSRKPFVQAGLLAGWENGAFRAELAQYLARVGKPEWLGELETRAWVWLGEARLNWRFLRTGFVWRTSPLSWFEMGNPAYLIYLSGRLTRFLEVGVTEDLPRFDTSPDIGFFLRLKLGD